MPKQNTKSTVKKTVVVKMRKSHRVLIFTMFAFLFICMLAAMIHVISSSAFDVETALLLLVIPAVLFLPCPLYYATWQITFDAEGMQKRLWGIKYKKREWTQVKEVRSAWLISERSYGIWIVLKDRKAIRFRMDCENAEAAKKLILSHCSITEHRGMIWRIYQSAKLFA